MMHNNTEIAELVRDRCIVAALQAYEDAGISGLCAEGRWELAIQAMRCLDLQSLVSSLADNERA